MLRPTKHTNLQSASINIGMAVLQLLRAQGRASFADVDVAIHRRCGEVSPRRVQEMLVLLYAVGALDYSDEIDAFVPTASQTGAR
jgi:hypothetical protein